MISASCYLGYTAPFPSAEYCGGSATWPLLVPLFKVIFCKLIFAWPYYDFLKPSAVWYFSLSLFHCLSLFTSSSLLSIYLSTIYLSIYLSIYTSIHISISIFFLSIYALNYLSRMTQCACTCSRLRTTCAPARNRFYLCLETGSDIWNHMQFMNEV